MENRLGKLISSSYLPPYLSDELYAGVVYDDILVPLDVSPAAELGLEDMAIHVKGMEPAGYDPRALVLQTLVACLVLPLTWLVTDRQKNINWVFGPGEKPQDRIDPRLYLLFVLLFFPLVVYLPTHWLLLGLFGRHGSAETFLFP